MLSGYLLCIETHDDWVNPEFLVPVLKEINSPALKVTWDIMHPILRGLTMEEAFEAYQPWIAHVHVHDKAPGEPWSPIGTGNIDHKTALACLKKMNYNGYISGEWINWTPYEEHLPREIKLMKELEPKDD